MSAAGGTGPDEDHRGARGRRRDQLAIRNAWIDFSAMDCSIVAVVSDVVRDGEPVVGYGFNSNGRYSAGEIIRRRIVPRLLAAEPDALLAEDGQLDPTRAWTFMMNNEKPGGHGERSVAVGVVDMALFDLAAKLAGQPLYRWLSDRYGDGAARRARCSSTPRAATTPRARPCADLQDEMRGLPRPGLPRGQDEDRRRRPRRGPAPHRGRAGGARRRRLAAGASTSTAASTWPPRWSTARPSSPTACSGTRRSATRWTTGSTPRSASTTAGRSPPGRTCSRCRTPAT